MTPQNWRDLAAILIFATAVVAVGFAVEFVINHGAQVLAAVMAFLRFYAWVIVANVVLVVALGVWSRPKRTRAVRFGVRDELRPGR